ncbi:MAG TPA: hypothetical protein PKD64_12130 [Pirellulaceae bacterium]|nr:hypothetical protein [Pirellulaceae bacterium]HMO92934.1 hypothetical protein [Pirellulaceae bacterium]HMP68501.1 hypothetical protein [Pirellulaceae bacterium]
MHHDRLADPDFRIQRRVRWIETDQSGTLHFCNIPRLMEEAEYAFLKSRGLNVVLTDERGLIGFPRVSADFEIKRAVHVDELLSIWLKLIENNGITLQYRFEITDELHQLIGIGEFEVACCRFHSGELPRAILIPDFVMERLRRG